MATFKKTNIKAFTKTATELTPDNLYWKKYSAPTLVKEFGPVDYIDFSPVEPHYFAVTCSARVQIYNPITKVPVKHLSRFQTAAYGGSFRKDGRLLIAGGEEGKLKLFDISTKNMLRLFAGHTSAVHRTFFTTDGVHITSFSDDKTVGLWDIPNEKQLVTFNEHTDYVRAGAVSPISPDIFISGSYDKTVNMYDARSNKKVCSVTHDAPVESVMFLPSGGVFLSAGGTEIRAWDALSGGKLLAKISSHHKTITCLKIASDGHRLLSGSLDRHVKIYDVGTYKTVHSLDYPNAILSIGISSDNETIVAGMSDSLISIRRRETETKEEKPVRKKPSYWYSGKNLHVADVDVVVKEDAKQIMGKYDVCLRKFEYTKALNTVLVKYVMNKTPHVTVALLQELIRRQGLEQALGGRDEKSLVSIIKFLIRHLGSARFGRVLLHVTNVLIEVYEDELDGLGNETKIMLRELTKKLKDEEELILSLLELQGALQTVMNSNVCTPHVYS